MMNRTFFYSAAGLVCFLTAFLVWVRPSDEPREFVRSLDATPERFDRDYIKYDPEAVRRIDLSDSLMFGSPAHVKTYDGKLYVSDFHDFSIHEFTADGFHIGTLSPGKGRGPGELIHLTDFDMIRDTLWVTDSQRLMIHAFDMKSREYITSISTEKRPSRIACLEDGFIVQWFGNETLFSKFDLEGNELFEFGELIEDQVQNAFSLDGWILSNRADRFVFIPLYASLIYHYDKDGVLINILKTPEGMEFQPAERVNGFLRAPDPEFKMVNAYFDESDHLYVHTSQSTRYLENGQWIYEGTRTRFTRKTVPGRTVFQSEEIGPGYTFRNIFFR